MLENAAMCLPSRRDSLKRKSGPLHCEVDGHIAAWHFVAMSVKCIPVIYYKADIVTTHVGCWNTLAGGGG